MKTFDFSGLRSLAERDECELCSQHEAAIAELLPLIGPLFGIGVILFNVWDRLIDPAHALTSLTVRFTLVLIGAAAYFSSGIPWTPMQRFAFIYVTHAGAIVICDFLLKDGFLYGLGGITACLFLVSVLALSLRNFLMIIAVPALLFIVLSAASMPFFAFANNLMLYCFSVIMAGIALLAMRFFHQKAFLLEKELLHLSRYDSLSGASNRKYLTELAEHELALSKRHHRALAVAMIDIDHFKIVNDTYGHSAGDEVIRSIVLTCQRNLREIDHFGRIGGEEFVCILPETEEHEAMLCAERLRLAVEEMQIEIPSGKIKVTVSIGVAILHSGHADWASILNDADKAMYLAKQGGRNRVMLADRCKTQSASDSA